MSLSVVYGREIDGEETTFGTTGYTYKNTFLLYDRKTESVWYPLEPGKLTAVGGKLKGREIPFIAQPRVMALSVWREEHPDSLVLVGGRGRAASRDSSAPREDDRYGRP